MPPTVQQGSTGDAVSKAQYLLVRWLILPSDQIDGSFGPATTHAVQAFQSDEGLTVDGIVGPNTWQALLAGFSIPPELSTGSSGSVVGRLQRALNNGRDEFAPGSQALATDGSYGPATKARVEAFQRWGDVPDDGVVDLRTWGVSLHAAGQVLASVVGV
jgi:peptidoglycan hydrolase-like protein with peptidoglycan-binding domain